MVRNFIKNAGTLEFRKSRQSLNRDSHLVLYQACLSDRVFTYLYLRPATYVLVWKAPRNFRFNCELPFQFIDNQFSYLSPGEIELVARILPKRGTSIMEHYVHPKCMVTMVLAGEEGPREYDLVNATTQQKYTAEIAQNKDVLARIDFARYDSLVEYRRRFINCSLTAENLGDEWELTVTLPRFIELTDGALKWIVRNHSLTEMRKMDFKESRAALSEMIKPQSDLVYAEV